MDARGVVLNLAWKGLVFTEKIEEKWMLEVFEHSSNSSGSVVLYMWSYHSMDENW